jgi:LPS export ABC transporter protein LptC
MHRYICWIALLALLAACGSDATTPAVSGDLGQLPADQVIYGLRHVMTKDGVRTAVLEADTAYLYEEGRRFDLMGVQLQFFEENGAESGNLVSDAGEYNLSTGLFIARTNVVLVTSPAAGGRRLETEVLHYDVRNDQLWSDTAFVLVEAGRTTQGTRFRSDARFERWDVTGARTQDGGRPGSPGISF